MGISAFAGSSETCLQHQRNDNGKKPGHYDYPTRKLDTEKTAYRYTIPSILLP
jgi:hypothetical protein